MIRSDILRCVLVFPLPAPPTDPMMTPASTPLSVRGLGTLGAMTGDLVGGDEELQRGKEEKSGEVS